ncbi:tumor necrosis factor receptor superfamily member 19-like isoform X3 [Notolabrus celidotus]|uniref:tumor necrosis factor receptor superfamily member 19-like isoform X3 n=1 Tax=Notolabrus celidotus TaxID=1203425 RepID=UPI00149046F2|nr:tumor necrosis factor receptor superfamily member 19-like isoform X3 [Notolabrus celidotus]
MVLKCQHTVSLFLTLHVMYSLLIFIWAEEETRECRELEFKDRFGNCKPCKQCDPGQELSKECGFGYGEDAQCVPCRSSRFKEDRSLQKCKPCLDCGLINRFQKGNCSTTSNAVCGDCLSGRYYRKTKLSGFQDMECIICGEPPPPYEPHCTGRVNLVLFPSVVGSPQDMVLAAVICSALATVMLALMVLCVIYCKRQLLERKPSGPVHLIPSLYYDESYSLGGSQERRPFEPQSLCDRNRDQDEEGVLMQFGENPDSPCKESTKMRGTFKPSEYFGQPLSNSEHVERLQSGENEMDKGERCKPRAISTVRQTNCDAVTDSLLQRQHFTSQEG